MRLWSIHPKYLDSSGLVAQWREGLLAKKVLEGKTRGYRNHPQLDRFKHLDNPLEAINFFLQEVFHEAGRRGYHFNSLKIDLGENLTGFRIPVSRGQVNYEFSLLQTKLKIRNPVQYRRNVVTSGVDLHSLFETREGGVEAWERIKVLEEVQ